MHTLIQDVRCAWRQLRYSPEFAVLAVITLALGIGANTAMFTVIEGVLLRPLPYVDANRLIAINESGPDSGGSVSFPDYRDIRDQARTLESLAGYSSDVGVVQSPDASVSVVTSEVTTNLFRILGVRPLRGRTFRADEGQPNGPKAVILSEGLWRKTFGSDPSIIGRSVRVNGKARTVIGVMPRTLGFPESAGVDVENGVWLPIQPSAEAFNDRNYRFFLILAKLARGATVPQVQTELRLITARAQKDNQGASRKPAFRAVSYLETVTGQVRAVFLTLMTALALVLLIACANVANLLIARCLGRRHEFAVRTALGCGHLRLIRQMAAEAGLLSVLGSAVGLLLTYWITAAVHRLPPGTIPRADAIEVRWTVVVVLGMVATLTTVLSAVLPALVAGRTDPQSALQAHSRSLGTKSVGIRVGGLLVAGEVALSALLLVAAALLFRTLWGLEHVPLGFDAVRVSSFAAMPADAAGFGNLTQTGQDHAPVSVATTFYQPLLEAMRSGAGVQGAALITAPPFSGIDLEAGFRVVGWRDQTGLEMKARITALSGSYERLMGTPVVRGRGITEQDTANAPFVTTINETFAKKYFAGKDPLGEQLDLGGKEVGMAKPYMVVGIIADQIDTSNRQPPQPLLMLPYQQIPATSLFYPALLKTIVHFVVKTRGNVSVSPMMRAIFHRVAPNLALDNFQTMQEAVDQSNFGSRISLYLIASFAGLAALLVIAGLYGVLAQVVNQRRREFGVRMALGATRRSIVNMVLLQGLAIVTIGLAAGFVLALATGGLIKSFLYGVRPLDGIAYSFVLVVLFGVGILAALAPAWRAASLGSVEALRDG